MTLAATLEAARVAECGRYAVTHDTAPDGQWIPYVYVVGETSPCPYVGEAGDTDAECEAWIAEQGIRAVLRALREYFASLPRNPAAVADSVDPIVQLFNNWTGPSPAMVEELLLALTDSTDV